MQTAARKSFRRLVPAQLVVDQPRESPTQLVTPPAITGKPGLAVPRSTSSPARVLDESCQAFVPGLDLAPLPHLRILIAAENRLLRESLSHLLLKLDGAQISRVDLSSTRASASLLREPADILLLLSSGNLADDLQTIHNVRVTSPSVLILMMGMSGEPAEFLQCVRSGVRAYLLRDASTEDVLAAVRSLRAGEVVCPGSLCALLFRYFERESCSLPSASVHLHLGLTRREQQLIPLVAEGRTNKEIANHFCLSEQTVKNHLYRMKHKVGAADRLGIVQVCRSQGFLV
jgi:DNA-binding NarL/FixJ family response regulator